MRVVLVPLHVLMIVDPFALPPHLVCSHLPHAMTPAGVLDPEHNAKVCG